MRNLTLVVNTAHAFEGWHSVVAQDPAHEVTRMQCHRQRRVRARSAPRRDRPSLKSPVARRDTRTADPQFTR
eukprot:SAG11_NODE_2385_length_3419_cov_2.038855_2_plen_72_part_00